MSVFNTDPTYLLVSKWSYSSYSNQQVAPQAAKTMSPQFAPMGGFGGSSNSFGQMPTGAAPTQTNSANYPPINARASLNTNGYGRLCAYICMNPCLCLHTGASSHPSVLYPRWLSVWGTVPLSSSGGSVASVAGPAALAE